MTPAGSGSASPRVGRVADALMLGVTLGMIFAPLAGLMAFLITYEEYLHRYPRGPAMRAGLAAGVWTFFVFLVLSVVGTLAFMATQ
jgi:hypothetical protein